MYLIPQMPAYIFVGLVEHGVVPYPDLLRLMNIFSKEKIVDKKDHYDSWSLINCSKRLIISPVEDGCYSVSTGEDFIFMTLPKREHDLLHHLELCYED